MVVKIHAIRQNDSEYRSKKHIFIWASRKAAVTQMTKIVRDIDPNKTNIRQLYSLKRLHFLPESNKFHCRADSFGIVRVPNERAEDV